MKNKHFYQIFKLKIKPWIKYWLIKQTEFKGVLSDILEGIIFYLTDSLNMKFKIFKIYGRTTQDGNPTPENPVPIKNTGDNGSVNEKVQNKNLFDKSILEQYKVDEDDEAYIFNNQTLFNKNLTPNIKFKEKTAYTIQYIAKQTTGNSRLSIVYTDGTVYGKPYVISTSYTLITLTSNENKTIDYISEVYGSSATKGFYIKKNSVQIEQGTTATSYVPHAEQNISFPLSEGQKLMEGDYLADDGIHSLWNEDTVNGTTATFSDAKTNGAYYCNQKVSGNLTGQTITFDTSVTNAIVQYELAQEQVIPYTEEQKTAWEQIKNLKTYKPVTHISSEDETPAELKIQYWKEVQIK